MTKIEQLFAQISDPALIESIALLFKDESAVRKIDDDYLVKKIWSLWPPGTLHALEKYPTFWLSGDSVKVMEIRRELSDFDSVPVQNFALPELDLSFDADHLIEEVEAARKQLQGDRVGMLLAHKFAKLEAELLLVAVRNLGLYARQNSFYFEDLAENLGSICEENCWI